MALLVGIAELSLRASDRPSGAPPLQAAHARPLREFRLEPTPQRIERGRYLANAAIGCVLCHSERDRAAPGAPPIAGREFAGAVVTEEPGYRLVAPNLTPDVETGAGSWSDDMLMRAIREGVGHDGRGIGGQMFWWAFRVLSDEDVASIVVYLRSLPAVRHELPPRLLSEAAERERAESARPLTEPVPERDLSTSFERGRYLIEMADCLGCHTAWEAPVNAGAFAGGNPIERFGERTFSANLTPDPSALGGWTAEMFLARIRSGRGGTLHASMPWVAYRQMSDNDLRAIYGALREVPPVRHWINNVDPPTDCPVCGQRHGLGAMNSSPVYAAAEVDLGPLAHYVGRFRLRDDTVEIEITTDGRQLLASEEGGRQTPLVPGADGRLHGIGLVSPIGFERDASGAVTGLLTFELGTSYWDRQP